MPAMRPAAEPDISMKPPYSPVPSLSSSDFADCWNCDWALRSVRSVALAAVSLADRRAARRFGMAMAAMMAMIAITIINSIRVKPDCLLDMGGDSERTRRGLGGEGDSLVAPVPARPAPDPYRPG